LATLSNWLLTPLVRFQNGDSITFWTRTFPDSKFPDRLQVRLSTAGGSTNVGTTATQVGDFTILLLDVNPTYQVGGYPELWQQYTLTVSGVPTPAAGRFAFRYFVENGGPNGTNSNGVGIDTVAINTCLAPPSIAGTVTYGNAIGAPTTRYVSNTTITASGSVVQTATTGAPGATAGQYSIGNFGGGAYTITPSKIGGANGISSFDSGRISQHSLGPPLPHLAGNQLIVADVSGNGTISSFDAGQIAKYVAGTPPWGLTGTWKFDPASRDYPSLTNPLVGQDYSALLMGEVSGNWTNSGARSPSPTQSDPENRISVYIPQVASTVGREITVPVLVDRIADKEIIAYEFELTYDPAVVQPAPESVVVKGTASRGLFAVVNSSIPGILRVVMYGPIAIDTNGVLLNLHFNTIGSPANFSPLKFARIMFNEDETPVTISDGEISLSATLSD
jgi:hypothetical protein